MAEFRQESVGRGADVREKWVEELPTPDGWRLKDVSLETTPSSSISPGLALCLGEEQSGCWLKG